MPRGKVHALIGVGAWWWLNPVFPLNFFLVVAGSLFPDCDIKHSPAGKILPLWAFGVKHRGLTHTLWAAVLVSAAIYWFKPTWGLSFLLGYMTHLIADSSTPMGVNWLGRKTKRKGYRQMR